jgi:nitroreductase
MDILDVITSRRSIRSFLNKPVEEEKLVKILDSARWAPTAGNTQECRFIVVKEQAARMQIAEACLGQFWIASAPLLIIVCAKMDIIGAIYGEIGRKSFAFMDSALAAQNMMLMAHSLGLGSCMVASFEEEYVKRVLSLPEEVKPLAIIPIGYPTQIPKPPYRKNLESVVFFEQYGKMWIKHVSGTMSGPAFLKREELL